VNRTRKLSSTLIAFALAAPSAAAAHPPRYLAPPGNSGLSQYLEVVPSDMGQAPPSAQPRTGGALTTGQRQQLNRLGPDGRTLAAVAESTAPPPAQASAGVPGTHRPQSARQTGSGSDLSQPPPSQSARDLSPSGASSPADSVLSAAVGTDGGGVLGILLPILLLTCAVAVIGRAIWRRAQQS
jgi:hypothetical protein